MLQGCYKVVTSCAQPCQDNVANLQGCHKVHTQACQDNVANPLGWYNLVGKLYKHSSHSVSCDYLVGTLCTHCFTRVAIGKLYKHSPCMQYYTQACRDNVANPLGWYNLVGKLYKHSSHSVSRDYLAGTLYTHYSPVYTWQSGLN